MLPSFIVGLSVDGEVAVLGDVVEPLLEPMPLVLGDVLSVVLGDVVVLGDAELGDVEVVLSVLGDVVVGAFEGDGVVAEFGVPADEFAPLVLESDAVPLVCAYARPAATARATLVPTAMDLNLLMTRLLS